MSVNVISISKPSAITGCHTAEELIAYCARVSNPVNQENHKTAAKLIKYLLKAGHYSPLEMVSMTIEINTTRDIARQMLRHRSFSFQEFSQRYAEVNTDDFILREARLQDSKNRQNSIETDDLDLQKEWDTRQAKVIKEAEEQYRWAIDNKIAKEQARVVLPEGLTPSRLYMHGTLRSWVHYYMLRIANGTQKEHALVAFEIKDLIRTHFPNIVEACDEILEEEKN